MPKLKNRPCRREEVQASVAREAARGALKAWYDIGHNRANALLPNIQINSNLYEVGQIPGWQEQKGDRNGYVMLTSLLSGTQMPLIVVLDYEEKATGGLTYRRLHQQVREALQLESKCSLRLCPFKPWYRYMQKSFPVPEHKALPASEGQCRHLLGTTLIYYTYVHLTN